MTGLTFFPSGLREILKAQGWSWLEAHHLQYRRSVRSGSWVSSSAFQVAFF